MVITKLNFVNNGQHVFLVWLHLSLTNLVGTDKTLSSFSCIFLIKKCLSILIKIFESEQHLF